MPSGVKKCQLDGFQKKQKFSPLSRREGRKIFLFLPLQKVRTVDPMVDPRKGLNFVDFVLCEWSLLLGVELLAGGAVVRGGVLEELVEEGHLTAGPPVPRVVAAPHWKDNESLEIGQREVMRLEGFKNVSIG